MGPRRRRGDALSFSLGAALAPALAPASPTPPPTPTPGSPAPPPEWARVASAVADLFGGGGGGGAGGDLATDVRALLRGRARPLVPDFVRGRVLPGAMRALAREADADTGEGEGMGAGTVAALLVAWRRLLARHLPALLALFAAVKNTHPPIRALVLLAFRDEVLLPREVAVRAVLTASTSASASGPAEVLSVSERAQLTQLLLWAVQAPALGAQGLPAPPPDAARLRVESLAALAVAPYLGLRGLYEGGGGRIAVPSREIELAAARRPSGGVEFRRLQRPLSVSSGQQLQTLSDLFARAVARSPDI